MNIRKTLERFLIPATLVGAGLLSLGKSSNTELTYLPDSKVFIQEKIPQIVEQKYEIPHKLESKTDPICLRIFNYCSDKKIRLWIIRREKTGCLNSLKYELTINDNLSTPEIDQLEFEYRKAGIKEKLQAPFEPEIEKDLERLYNSILDYLNQKQTQVSDKHINKIDDFVSEHFLQGHYPFYMQRPCEITEFQKAIRNFEKSIEKLIQKQQARRNDDLLMIFLRLL